MRAIKKIVSVILVSAMMCTMAACGSGGTKAGGTGTISTSKSVNDVLDEQVSSATEDSSGSETDAADNTDSAASDDTSADDTAKAMDEVNSKLDEASAQAEKTSDGSVDVDLTALSSTMVYSEVYNMVNTPNDYIGKTVRMEGNLAVYHDDTDNNDYYACVVKDATACCAQGIEFVLKDGNYPEANTEVKVVGTFSSYKIGDYEYYTLKDAVME